MCKKMYLPLLLLIFFSSITHAQENAISISNFTVKNSLPPDVKSWTLVPASLLLVAQNNTWGDRAVKLSISIKRGDTKICGNADGISLDYFKTRSFQTNDLIIGLGNCETLQPGDYTVCVVFRGMNDARQWVNVSAEVCKPFNVGGGSSGSQNYTGPSIISPENGKVFTKKEANGPITFRWTPVVPKPQEPVKYRLRVWQLMQGQTGGQAMKTNQPIITKDIDNITQTVISNLEASPCNPPYMCSFIFNVEATNKEGKPYGENNGTSESVSFTITNSEPSDFPLNVEQGEIIHMTITRPCIKCNNLQINSANTSANINSSTGILSISQSLAISPDAVKQLTAAIVYTEWKPQDEKCMPCDKDLRQWGVLQSAVLNNNGSGVPNTSLSASDAQWTVNAMLNNSTVQLKLQFPALLSSCILTGKVCVRYRFIVQPATGECYECEKLICYTF